MMMMRSFTTFVTLLAATFSLATAMDGFTMVIGREKWTEAHCTPTVNDEIDNTLRDCVEEATGVSILPTRRYADRRLGTPAAVIIDEEDTHPIETRELQVCAPGCTCPENIMCPLLGYCSEGCNSGTTVCAGCPRRRLEEGFRELTAADDALIKTFCRQAVKKHAQDAHHNCLGDKEKIEVFAFLY
jgi:hypothetical protein